MVTALPIYPILFIEACAQSKTALIGPERVQAEKRRKKRR